MPSRQRQPLIGRSSLMLLLTATACTVPVAAPLDGPLPTRQTLIAWVEDRPHHLRDAAWAGDSLVGRALAPDTARVALPRAAIDSLQVARATDPGAFVLIGAGVGVGILALYVLAWNLAE